jgi:hypothetical protein
MVLFSLIRLALPRLSQELTNCLTTDRALKLQHSTWCQRSAVKPGSLDESGWVGLLLGKGTQILGSGFPQPLFSASGANTARLFF